MDHVLDLKNPKESSHESDTTTDIATPIQARVVGEPVSTASPTDLMSLDELTALTLSATTPGRTIAWEAEHVLQGAARRKHTLFLILAMVLGIGVALWQSSLSVFFVVLCGVAALEVRQRWSRPVHVAIDEHGIGVDGHHYPHADVVSFDIHTMPDGARELSLHSGRWHTPNFRLPLGEHDHEEIRSVISQYVPEGRHAIPFVEYFMRKS